MRIAVIEYGMGNLRSVCNAVEYLGCESVVCGTPSDLGPADAIILPGVGAFPHGMKHLRERGWPEKLEQVVLGEHKPFLGICLGMQLLATVGTEHGECMGLGWIPGRVDRLPADRFGLRLPHIGWNDVDLKGNGALYAGVESPQAFYFVHSYHFIPDDGSVVTGIADYGFGFAASVQMGNVHATQYHPEKSHKVGLVVLRNFLKTIGTTDD